MPSCTTTFGAIASIRMAAAVKTYELVTGVAHVEVPIRRTLYPDDKGAFTFFRRDLERSVNLALTAFANVGHFDVGSLVNLLSTFAQLHCAQAYAPQVKSGETTFSFS